ncbi:hypothetical protein SRABI76_00254 [Microbacterium oxydans]|uniref:polysaccharide pyruvyl transferase family protein n=1 Tax=Microbacterium oxydans TaxID=82380 RepID=UPI001E1224FA|nr:polysaccharide pyruvyl transferase family protein [Microbacterium oxydans]CAH0129206.1 hypothetical protein SRABI76_00254 [Microbacterium oxydans]
MKSLFRRAIRRARSHATALEHKRGAPIYLISAAGQPNFGDEFITRSWLDWLGANHPRREVWLDCMEPGRAAHLFRDTHPRLRTTNTLWQTAHAGAPDDIVAAAQRMEKLVTGLGSPKADLGLRDLRRMHSLHLLGGGYMNTLWPKNLGILAAMVAVKQHFGVPIHATGQGLLPYDERSLEVVSEQLRHFDSVEARDAPSAEAFGVHAGTDDAFLAFANRRRIYAPRDRLPQRMILVQGDMFAEEQSDDLQQLVSTFVGAADSPAGVGFAEAIPPEDARFAAPHVDGGAQMFPFMRMWEEGFPATSGQEWLTSRFHFHLLAAAAGARGTIVNAQAGYYDVKHDLLRELGTGWTTQERLDGTVSAPTSTASFPDIARQLGGEKARLAHQLYPESG